MFVRQGFELEDLLEWEGLDDYRVKRYDDEDDDNDDDEPEGGYKATARKEAGEVAARQGPGGDSSGVVCPAEIEAKPQVQPLCQFQQWGSLGGVC